MRARRAGGRRSHASARTLRLQQVQELQAVQPELEGRHGLLPAGGHQRAAVLGRPLQRWLQLLRHNLRRARQGTRLVCVNYVSKVCCWTAHQLSSHTGTPKSASTPESTAGAEDMRPGQQVCLITQKGPRRRGMLVDACA